MRAYSIWLDLLHKYLQISIEYMYKRRASVYINLMLKALSIYRIRFY